MSTFPFIRDLNPKIDSLGSIVLIIQKHLGDNEAIAEAIKQLFDKDATRTNYSLHSIKANTMSSLREANLGVMSADGKLTAFGQQLVSLVKDEESFKAAIARHLILEKGGLAFCRALGTVKRTGGSYRQQIADFLAEKYQVDFWRDLNNISSMHNFLEWAGVCADYRLDGAKFETVVGADTAAVKDAEELSPEAVSLLEALVRVGGAAPPGNLRRQVETLSGRRINPHSLPTYGQELSDRGLIELPRHRGSRTAQWTLKHAGGRTQVVARMAAALAGSSSLPDEVFNRSFAELLRATKTKNKDKKGRALEQLAGRVCWMLGLHNIQIRTLSDYEIDVRAEAHHPVFQKWVLQCKATQTALGPAPVLREYGIAKLENIPVIVFVVTATASANARSVADQIMKQSNKIVIILDRDELKTIAADEKSIYEILERQSEHARSVKIPQQDVQVTSELVGQTEEASASPRRSSRVRRRPGAA